ncbi:MAG: WYL domain-containing protein, partial [Bacteroidales bacterium]|nr:WYL domain-containing protein [Bacteroidales bacterium]
MAKNYFNRYVWLIDTIRSHGYITFSDISDLWQKAAINEDGSYLPERTFFNHREAISDIFGIEIRFDKSLGYYITEDSNDTEGIRSWLLTSLSVNNLINESAAMHSRILFEKIP